MFYKIRKKLCKIDCTQKSLHSGISYRKKEKQQEKKVSFSKKKNMHKSLKISERPIMKKNFKTSTLIRTTLFSREAKMI